MIAEERKVTADHLLAELDRLDPVELERFGKMFRERWGVAGVPGIDKTPDVCGGSARILRTRIPVWSLVEKRRLGQSDENILANYPGLRPEDLLHAWEYFQRRPAEIEQEIVENNEVE